MKKTLIGMGTAMLAIAGCATTHEPQALTAANEVYANAEGSGQAQRYAPNQLEDARRAIERAENSYNDDPDSQRTEDLAYIAHRRALIAQWSAQDEKLKQSTSEGKQQQESLEAAHTNNLEHRVKDQAKALEASEAKAREASLALEQARADLARIAATKETAESLTLTIQGAVLFRSNEATLLPAAQDKLKGVADVLMRNEDKGIVVVGHTDSRGNDSANQDLSLRRAQAVVDYFVTQGVTKDRIEARGMGESQPVADNESAEGRANNRRVEIIIPKAPEPQ